LEQVRKQLSWLTLFVHQLETHTQTPPTIEMPIRHVLAEFWISYSKHVRSKDLYQFSKVNSAHHDELRVKKLKKKDHPEGGAES